MRAWRGTWSATSAPKTPNPKPQLPKSSSTGSACGRRCITAARQCSLWLVIPLIVLLLLATGDEPVRPPGWDDGVLDVVDVELLKKGLATPGADPARAPFTPKLAFLFMTRGPMPLETIWAHFLEGNEEKFKVYIHASTAGTDMDAIVTEACFRGRQVPSVSVSWGGFNMVRAERRLIAAALTDPTNQRFILLSESCLPIHNFSYIYNYLFTDDKSFVASYQSMWRYKVRMAPVIQKEQLRKGSQWVVLIREHAAMVTADSMLYDKFVKTRSKVPDEGYIQTLLPMVDADRVAPRSVMYVHWQYLRSRHPMTFGPHQITPSFLQALQTSYMPQKENTGFLLTSHPQPCSLGGNRHPCYLFARKFTADAVPALLNASVRAVLGY